MQKINKYALLAASLTPLALIVSCGGGATETAKTSAVKTKKKTGGEHTHTHAEQDTHVEKAESCSGDECHTGTIQVELHEDLHSSAPMTFDGYVERRLIREVIAENERSLVRQGAAQRERAGVLKDLLKRASEARTLQQQLVGKYLRISALTQRLELARQEVEVASAYNWRLGKEVMLYLFTLKPIWGLFTGFAPTTSTTEQRMALEHAEQVTLPELQSLEQDIRVLEDRMTTLVSEVTSAFEEADQRMMTHPLIRAALSHSKLVFQRVMHELPTLLAQQRVAEEQYREQTRVKYPHLPNTVASSSVLADKDNYIAYHTQEVKLVKQSLEKATGMLNNLLDSTDADYSLAKLLERERASVAENDSSVEKNRASIKRLSKEIAELESKNPTWGQKFLKTAQLSERIQTSSELEQELRGSLEKLRGQSDKNDTIYAAAAKVSDSIGVALDRFSDILSASEHLRKSLDNIRVKASALEHARSNRVSFFKEFALYTLGFKWLWGWATGFAPTVDASEEYERLMNAQEEHESLVKSFMDEVRELQERFAESLSKFTAAVDELEAFAVNDEQRDFLETIRKKTLQFFEQYRFRSELAHTKQDTLLGEIELVGREFINNNSSWIADIIRDMLRPGTLKVKMGYLYAFENMNVTPVPASLTSYLLPTTARTIYEPRDNPNVEMQKIEDELLQLREELYSFIPSTQDMFSRLANTKDSYHQVKEQLRVSQALQRRLQRVLEGGEFEAPSETE